uniref:Glycosyltransferase N-terminal domain-containing protein n=1 Tax=Oryza barthii TaxID=65489 RepID=A0A0D3GP20_9ORYZ
MATQEREPERQPHAGRRVALFPLPFQGHLSPMLQLADLLRARGLAVTVLHTRSNAPDPARHRHGPDLAFLPIHEAALPEEATSPGADIVAQLLALNAACEAPFRDALASLLPGVACAVVDGQWYAALGAAARLGNSDECHFVLAESLWIIPAGERLDEAVPELEPLRVRDLIRVDGCETEALCGFIARVADAMRDSASGVVVNTFDAIEASELGKIEAELSKPTFAVGPLHKLTTARTAAEQYRHFVRLYGPDRACLAWLDAHPPRSVLYVSLGSVACIDHDMFDEMAWGLAASGVPFLWVNRPGSVRGCMPALPYGVDVSRGKIVPWAPQRDVLAHPAIGGFWTHCGWNSTLESVCEGVPMLARPCFADQTVNARYVTHQWGVGLELGEVFDRDRVAVAVRKLMVGEEGAAMRETARRLKIQANQCVAATLAIDNLVKYICSL